MCIDHFRLTQRGRNCREFHRKHTEVLMYLIAEQAVAYDPDRIFIMQVCNEGDNILGPCFFLICNCRQNIRIMQNI